MAVCQIFITNLYKKNNMTTIINKRVCSHCGQTVNDRVISIYSGMVKALIRIYVWCKKNNRNEFSRKEIKHLFRGVDNEIARWGDWIIFGAGMIYRPSGKGTWGLNLDRVEDFIRGNKFIPILVSKGANGDIKILESGTINQVKNLSAFLDESRMYVAEYIN